jgi:chromosome segregation ATPase
MAGQTAALYNSTLHAANVDAVTGVATGTPSGHKKKTQSITQAHSLASVGDEGKQSKHPTVASVFARIAEVWTEINSDLAGLHGEINNGKSTATLARVRIETINATLARHDKELAALQQEVASLRRTNEQLNIVDSTGSESSDDEVEITTPALGLQVPATCSRYVC